jgi:hypothetical protein
MQIDREKLAKFLGMLGSDGEGEVINAGRMAHKMLKQARLSWPEVLDPAGSDADQRFVFLHDEIKTARVRLDKARRDNTKLRRANKALLGERHSTNGRIARLESGCGARTKPYWASDTVQTDALPGWKATSPT